MHLAAENDGERAAGERSLAVLLGSCANQVAGKVGDQGVFYRTYFRSPTKLIRKYILVGLWGEFCVDGSF